MICYFLPLPTASTHLLLWILESLWCSSGYIPQFSNFSQSLLSLSAPKLGVSLIYKVLNNSISCLHICFLFLHFLIHLPDSACQPSLVLISVLLHSCTYLPIHFSPSNSIAVVLPTCLPVCLPLLEKQVDAAGKIKNLLQCLRGSQGIQNHEGPYT